MNCQLFLFSTHAHYYTVTVLVLAPTIFFFTLSLRLTAPLGQLIYRFGFGHHCETESRKFVLEIVLNYVHLIEVFNYIQYNL